MFLMKENATMPNIPDEMIMNLEYIQLPLVDCDTIFF